MNEPSEVMSEVSKSTPDKASRINLWLPFFIALAALVLMFFAPGKWHLRWISTTADWVFSAGLLWFLGLAVVRFCQKRVAAGFGALGLLALLFVALIGMGLMAFIRELGGDSKDGFADDLQLPAGVDLAEPEGEGSSDLVGGGQEDRFQAAIRAALTTPGSENAEALFELPSLARLRKDHPNLLDRFLAAHPGWRVYEERGSRFATRRWMDGNKWRITLHGYYSAFERDAPRFQSRTTLALSGAAWGKGAQRITPGVKATVNVRGGNDLLESYVVIPVEDLLVEFFEQSDAPERRITMAAAAELEREFAALLAVPDWSHAEKWLPQGAITIGDASIELSESFQWGLYNAAVRCNPGKAGRVYLKAFEITRNHPLSTDRLKSATNEWVGWSDNPKEQFLSEAHFTIYEGDWGQFYGARFEVWFEPDDGSSERKILERNFKIQGWMR